MIKFILVLITLFNAINSYNVVPRNDSDYEEDHRIYEEFLANAVATGNWGEVEGNVFFGCFCHQNDLSKRYYAFCDIDGNGIDELLVGEKDVILEKEITTCYIYTIHYYVFPDHRTGEVKPYNYMGYFDQFDTAGTDIYENGWIVNRVAGEFDYGYSYYRVSDEWIHCYASLFREDRSWSFTAYSIDETIKCQVPEFIGKMIMNSVTGSKLMKIDWQSVEQLA